MSRQRIYYRLEDLSRDYNQLGEKIVIQKEDVGKFSFLIFDHPIEIYESLQREQLHNTFVHTYHDVCTTGQNAKFWLDVDCKTALNEEEREIALQNIVEQALICLKDIYNIVATTKDVWVTDSHTTENTSSKISSYHIFFQFVIGDNSRPYLFKRVKESVNVKYREFLDNASANDKHNLRMVRCCKQIKEFGDSKRYKILRHTNGLKTVQPGASYLRHILPMPDNMKDYLIYKESRPLSISGHKLEMMTREEFKVRQQAILFIEEYKRASLTFSPHCPVIATIFNPPKQVSKIRVEQEVLRGIRNIVEENDIFVKAGYRIGSAKYNAIELLRRRPGFCVVCQKTHDHEHGVLVIGENNNMFVRCYRASRAVTLEKYMTGDFDGSLYQSKNNSFRRLADAPYVVPPKRQKQN